MKKRFLKKSVAMLALIAMLSQNAFSAFAAVTDTAPVVENNYEEDSSISVETETAAEEVQEEEQVSEQPEIIIDSEETFESEDASYEESNEDVIDSPAEEISEEEPEVSDEIAEDTSEDVSDEDALEETEEIPEEAEEVESNVKILDSQISGSGVDSVQVVINTDGLNDRDKFRILFEGPESATFDEAVNSVLDKIAGGTYTFDHLNKEGFNIRVTSEDNVEITYSYVNGIHEVTLVSLDKEIEATLERTIVTLSNGSPVSAIDGIGFDSIKVDFVSEELSEDTVYNLVVDTDAEVKGNVNGLNSETESVNVTGLNDEEFTLYVQAAEGSTVYSEVIDTDVENGIITIEVSSEEVRVKKEYKYEDDQVLVTATLSDAAAVPDDAEFKVTPITSGPAYEAYMQALINTEDGVEYTKENTLLYDVAFLVNKVDEDGNVIAGEKVEFEPEFGSVSIDIQFKKSQLTEELGAVEDEEIVVNHLPLVESVKMDVDTTLEATDIDVDDIIVESVTADVDVKEEDVDTVSLSLSDLSVITITNLRSDTFEPYVFKGDTEGMTFKSILGDATNYGIVSEKMHVDGHMETNFATKVLDGNANIDGPKNEKGYGGVTYIGSYIGSDFKMSNGNGNKSKPIIYTTEDAVKNMGTNATGYNKNDSNSRLAPSPIDRDSLIYYDVYDQTYINNLVDRLIGSVRTTSNKLASAEKQYDFTKCDEGYDGEFKKIDIAGHSPKDANGIAMPGTYYIQFDDGEYTGQKLSINLAEGQTVVLNIPNASVKFQQIRVNGTNTSGDAIDDAVAQRVIFNCPNATYAETIGPVAGTFLVPNATFDNHSVAAGWLVAKDITYIGSQEWHCVYHDMPNPISNPTSLTFNVNKTLRRNFGNESPSFKFTLYEVNDATYYVRRNKVDVYKQKLGERYVSSYVDNQGTVSFDEITYNNSGTFYYVIQETPTEGWTADYTYAYIKVDVVAEESTAANGQKVTNYKVDSVKCAYDILGSGDDRYITDNMYTSLDKANAVANFVNTKVGGSPKDFSFVATKSFVDDIWPDGFKVKLRLEALDSTNKGDANWVSAKAPLPGGVAGPIDIEVSKNNPVANFGTVTFPFDCPEGHGELKSTVEGGVNCRCYMYKVTEVMPDGANDSNNYTVNGIKYDPTPRYIKIWVNQVVNSATGDMRVELDVNESTNLEVCGGDYKGAAFTNETILSGETEINGTKKVTPKSFDLKEGQFSFVITAPEGTPMPAKTTVSNDKHGNFSFGKIQYSRKDVGKSYTYTVTEQIPAESAKISGMTYSGAEFTVTVNVSVNNGKLVVDKTVKDKDGKDADITFVNKLQAYGEKTFEAKKKYNLALKGGEFKFKLEKEVDGTRQVLEENVVNGAAAANSYASVIFNTVEKYYETDIDKDFVYYITETIPADKDGITYDTTEYKVVVSVKSAGDDAVIITSGEGRGKAQLVISTTVNGSATGEAKFENSYKSEGSGVIKVKKDIDGKEVLKDKSFSFTVSETDNNNATKYTKTLSVTGDGTAVFDDITFDKAGTYTFNVKENAEGIDENGVLDGIKYDTSDHTITLVVEDDNKGNLVVKSQTNDGDTVTVETALNIKNTYIVKGTKTTIEGIKELTGRNLEEGEFTFIISADEGTPMPAVKSVTNGADGNVKKFTFGEINYESAGTYTYIVSEEKGNKAGVTYVTTPYTVVVEVADDNKGQLYIKSQTYNGGTSMTFTNTYDANGEATIKAFKNFVSDVKTLKANEFTFELSDENKKQIGELKTNGENGYVTFDKISYTLSQLNGKDKETFHYFVREIVTDSVKGYTYDTDYHAVDVEVTNNKATGKLDTKVVYAKSDKTDAQTITNTYEAKGGIVLDGTKKMLGRKIGSEEVIQMKLTPVGAVDLFGKTITDLNQPLTANVKRGTNHTEGTFAFNELTYTKVGDYTYTVEELKGDDATTTYSGVKYTVVVHVRDWSAEDASKYEQLKVTKEITAPAGSASLYFENSTTNEGEFIPVAHKSLVSKEGGNAIAQKNNQFTFKINGFDGTNYSDEAKSNSDGLVQFKKIEYKEAGTYKYHITEESTGKDGVTYSTEVYDLIVVAEETETNQLSVTGTYYKGDQIVQPAEVIFTNEYEAKGSTTLEAIKVLKNSEGTELNVSEADEFEFKLTGEGVNKTEKVGSNKKAVFTLNYTDKDLSGIKEGDKFVKVYTLEEINAGKPGYSYSDAKYNVIVTIKDAGDGSIAVDDPVVKLATAAPAEENAFVVWVKGLFNLDSVDAKFDNTYEAYGEVDFSATKKLTGGLDLTDDMFTFTISEAGDVIRNATNKGQDVTFAPISYTTKDIGTHVYTIEEAETTIKGVTCKTSAYTATVTVADVNRDGVLEVSTSLNGSTTNFVPTDKDGKKIGLCEVPAVEFENEYKAKDVSITIGGTKSVSNLTGSLADYAGKFSFTMKNSTANGNDKAYTDTQVNAADGSFVFEKITYTQADLAGADSKTFVYEVNEIEGNLPGIDYDTTTKYVTVTVVNNKRTGELEASVSGDPLKMVSFTNSLVAEDEVVINVTKKVTGKKEIDSTKSFDIKMVGIDGTANKYSASLIGDATENIATRQFTLDDLKNNNMHIVEKYEIYEDDTNKHDGYEYSKDKYTVTIDVTYDTANKKVVINKTVKSDVYVDGVLNTNTETVDGALSFTFTNDYTATGKKGITGKKLLQAGSLVLHEGDFGFELSGGKLEEPVIVYNDADGNITFSEDYFQFDQGDVGTKFEYTVKEINDSSVVPVIDGLSYSTDVYTIEATVADNGDGTLDVVLTPYNAGEASDIVFKNTFEGDDEVTFSALKELKGYSYLDNDMFSFKLEDVAGGKLAQPEIVTNTGKEVAFKTVISFNENDLNGDFRYKISEVKGDKNFKYSDAVYYAKVTVGIVDGKLKATRTYHTDEACTSAALDESAVKFVNEHESSTKTQIGGNKTIKESLKKVSAKGPYFFNLYENGEIIDTASTNEGAFAFKEISYSEADLVDATKNADTGKPERTFTYIVKERNDGKPHVQYDDTEYTVTVVLTYDDNYNLIVVGPSYSTGGTSVQTIAFENGYDVEGELPLEGEKKITGKALENGKYIFTLTRGDKTFTTTNNANKFEFAATNDYFKYTQNDIDTSVEYTLTETEAKDGSKIDTEVYTITDTISEEDGELKISRVVKNSAGEIVGSEKSSGIVFNNTYEAKGEVELDVTKVMVNKALAKDDFSFVIKSGNSVLTYTDEDGNEQPYRVTTTAAELEDGVATATMKFPVIKYNQDSLKNADGSYVKENTFVYTVVEEDFNKPGVTPNKEVYTVTVTVKDEGKTNDAGENILTVTKVITQNNKPIEDEGILKKIQNAVGKLFGNDSDNIIKFVNTYEAKGKWDPKGNKKLTGREFASNEFQFSISEIESLSKDAKVVKYTAEDLDGKNNVDGIKAGDPKTAAVGNINATVTFNSKNVPFLQYSYKDAGHHYYRVEEIEPADKNAGDYYDKTVFLYDVNVEDTGLGELTAQVVRMEYGDTVVTDGNFEFTFNNTYSAGRSVVINLGKDMEGRELGTDEYEFVIYDEQNPSKTATVKNVGKTVTFNKDNAPFLNYTLSNLANGKDATSFKYIISEKAIDTAKYPGVIKDENVYRVTVSVDQQRTNSGDPIYNGLLDADVTKLERRLSDNSWEVIPNFDRNCLFTFINKFEAKAKIDLSGIKHVKYYTASNPDVTTASMLDGKYEFLLYKYDTEADRTGNTNNRSLVDRSTCDSTGAFKLNIPEYSSIDVLYNANKNVYESPKTLYYRVFEYNPTSKGTHVDGNAVIKVGDVTYDVTEYDVNVTLTMNGTTKLGVDVKLADGTSLTKKENSDGSYTFGSLSYTNIITRITQIKGQKIWVGDDNSTEHDAITVNLLANGKYYNKTEASAPDWKFAFTNLPTVDQNGNEIKYTVEEIEVPGYISEISKDGDDYVITNTKLGKVTITKVDADTGLPLAGATLAVYDGSEEVEKWVSESSAHVLAAELTAGKTYTLKELAAPDGYTVAADQTFTAPNAGGSIVLTVRDKKIQGSVRLTKRDAATREAISGAEFALYAENGTRIYATGTAGSYKYTTSTSNGVFAVSGSGTLTVTGLPYGTYYFTEVTAPTGYSLSSERASFSVLTDGASAEVTYLNSKVLGVARLRKISTEGTRSLAGAVFELYAKTPTGASSAIASTIYNGAYYRVGTYTTDANGMIYVDNLPWDDYYFVEVSAPEGYVVNTDTNGDDIVYSFKVGERASSADLVYDLGTVTNAPRTPDTPPEDDGRRRGGVLAGVLGVRARPSAGVLGERIGPVTGDAANIFLWLLLLVSCVGAIIGVGIAGKKKSRKTSK